MGRQEKVNLETHIDVNSGGRTQIVSPATAGTTSTVVVQIARGHVFDKKRTTARTSKKPQNDEPTYTNKKHTEGTININMDYNMKEHKPMKDFTI